MTARTPHAAAIPVDPAARQFGDYIPVNRGALRKIVEPLAARIAALEERLAETERQLAARGARRG